jgi:hypothetical protein
LLESDGDCAASQPVTVGIPFARGTLHDAGSLGLFDQYGSVPLQTQALAHWSDGSVKWLLLDFLANGLRRGTNRWTLGPTREAESSVPPDLLQVTESPDAVVVETGGAEFQVSRKRLLPFMSVQVANDEVLEPDAGGVVFTDADGRRQTPRVDQVVVESRGPVRATVRLQGRSGALRFVARLCFFAGTGLVHLALTVHNPRRARHPGGLWDLGDRGSVLFRDLSLELNLRTAGGLQTTWQAEPDAPVRSLVGTSLEIYQDSSGGVNWRSTNHVNREGRVPCAFRGYRVRAGSEVTTGLRASPRVTLLSAAGSVSAAIPEFWQQFPKAIDTDGGRLRLRLFPGQFGDLFELQGGEQKTHTVWLNFAPPGQPPAALDWVDHPAAVHAAPEWYSSSGAVPYLLPGTVEQGHHFRELLEQAVGGENSLAARREIIDEYGWRNYGDLYADHEGAYYQGLAPVVSHYNNQYDVVHGTLLHYFRTGDPRWFGLCDPLARHVIDIDLYHTDQDRAAYNGGLFWHTDHYRDASTSSHRAYARANQKPGQPYGGGPCNEHNWTTGLLHYHYHTGHPAAREAVLGMAEWVIAQDDGRRTVFGLVDDGPSGLASCTTEPDFHGPGRGCGNAVNALLDAWLLSASRRYLEKAEELIRRCVHPHEDVASLDLLNAERRWSYTVFLSVLSRYLALKAEAGQVDRAYAYAQASLLHYAEWMLEHEVPYFDRPEQLEYPTETWAAQELRKANVLRLAAAHAGEPLRSRLLQRGAELADRAWSDLFRFERPATTRSLAIVFTEGLKDAAFRAGHVDSPPAAPGDQEFGEPVAFVAQRRRVLTRLRSFRGLATLFLRLSNPARWWRWFRPVRKLGVPHGKVGGNEGPGDTP